MVEVAHTIARALRELAPRLALRPHRSALLPLHLLLRLELLARLCVDLTNAATLLFLFPPRHPPLFSQFASLLLDALLPPPIRYFRARHCTKAQLVL